MKPREKGGVVDTDLNVYGVTGLKLAGSYIEVLLVRSLHLLVMTDLSIAPSNVNCVGFLRTAAPINNLIGLISYRIRTQPRLPSARKLPLSLQKSSESKESSFVSMNLNIPSLCVDMDCIVLPQLSL